MLLLFVYRSLVESLCELQCLIILLTDLYDGIMGTMRINGSGLVDILFNQMFLSFAAR